MKIFLTFVVVLLAGVGDWARGAAPALRVGAAKVEVTPTGAERPKSFTGVLDPLHARAIVVDNGAAAVALVSVDAIVIPEATWQNASSRIERELKIPAKSLLLMATHSHSTPFVPYASMADKVFEAVKLAQQRLQPARMGYGTGVSYLNVNRNIIDPKTHRWWEGPNYDGPSDKTVAVLTFESLAGEPLAVCYNYAMHAVISGQLDQLSADVPGAASHYIEDSFDNKVVALWSSGAAGDQNPIYFQQTYDLREIRVQDYAKRGEDISNKMPPGGQGLDRQNPTVQRLMNQQKQLVLSMGQLLGEEVLHVLRGVKRLDATARLYGNQKLVSCPGRERTDAGRAGYPGTYKDAGPIELRLSLVLIGDVALSGVDAELFSLIGQRLKKESRFARTMLCTLTNGRANSGYIPNEAAFGYNTFEVLSSKLKPGCAEDSIVEGLLDLMDEARKQ